MNRTMESRLAKLEAQRQVPEEPMPVHSLIAESEAEKEAKIAALIASGEACVDDLFIVRMIVDPPVRN